MIKRYLLTFGGLCLLVIGYLLTLLPLLIVRDDLSTATYFKAMMVWGLLVSFSFLPGVALLIKKIWFFHGSGQSVSEKQLCSILMAVNEMAVPIQIEQKGKRLLAKWRYDDPDWCEYMAAANVSTLYELRLKFQKSTNTVLVSDRFRRVNFDLCPVRVKTGLLAFPRPLLGIKRDNKSGLKQYKKMGPSNFQFKPVELKSPLLNTILAHGWNVRFTLF
jgi:hypothetical protein